MRKKCRDVFQTVQNYPDQYRFDRDSRYVNKIIREFQSITLLELTQKLNGIVIGNMWSVNFEIISSSLHFFVLLVTVIYAVQWIHSNKGCYLHFRFTLP